MPEGATQPRQAPPLSSPHHAKSRPLKGPPHDHPEYAPTTLSNMEQAIRAALPQWRLSPETTAHLLNISENATWRLDDPEQPAP